MKSEDQKQAMKNYQSFYNYSLVLCFVAIVAINVYCFSFLSKAQYNQRLSIRYANNNIDTLRAGHNSQTQLIHNNFVEIAKHEEEFLGVYQVIFKVAVADGEQHADHQEQIIQLTRDFFTAFTEIVRDSERNSSRLDKIESLFRGR